VVVRRGAGTVLTPERVELAVDMPRSLAAEPLAQVAAELGEGPAWDTELGVLSWVDILVGRVHVGSASGELLRTFELGRAVGCALPAAAGGFLLADADGFSLLSEGGAASGLLAVVADRPDLRFNDGKCDPQGRAWAGTMDNHAAPGAGTLYRLDAGPVATPVLTGVSVSNGLGWSPDGATMWFSDSGHRHVSAFEYDVRTGALGELSFVTELQRTAAVPDGLCVDDHGCIWVALWGGGAVHRYTPEGRLDTVVRVPADQVTSCCFGGSGLSTLFVTTARRGIGPEALARQPAAGGLFAVETGVTGPAAVPWRSVARP
jgi:sugar lactone lactonase YvrE